MSKTAKVFLKVLAVLCIAALLGAVIFIVALRHMVDQIASDVASLFASPSAQEAQENGRWPQSFAAIDLAAGPVDLVVQTGDGSFLIRDSDRQRQAVETGFPDFSGRQNGLLFMSMLFLSPPSSGISKIGLTFLRDGEVIGEATCWFVACGSDPTLKAYLADLTEGAPTLVEKSLLIDDHNEYLTLHQKLTGSSSRFGLLEPAAPKQKFPSKAYIELPGTYHAQQLSEQTVQAYSEALVSALGQRFRDRQAEFEIIAPWVTHETVSLPLLDCRTGELIYGADPLHWLSESFASMSVRIPVSATAAFADEIANITDWGFLPQGPASDRLFKPGVDGRPDLAELTTNPEYCVRTGDLELNRGVYAWTEDFPGYYLGWTEIEPSPPGTN